MTGPNKYELKFFHTCGMCDHTQHIVTKVSKKKSKEIVVIDCPSCNSQTEVTLWYEAKNEQTTVS